MSKENNQNKIDTQNLLDTVYIRGMNNDQKREGLSPLQKKVNAGLAGIMIGSLLSGCVPKGNQNTIETPAAGQAVAVGLLGEEQINNLPSGEVKDSLVAELESVKEECATIPGCLGDTIQIYRVIVPENVYSVRFANFDVEGEELHTEILSMYDWKTHEETQINKDLLAVNEEVNGVPTKAFGYVDDSGNSHYVFVDQGENKYLYDVNGNSYEVNTQNEKEVQSYSHLWEAPGVVNAEALPSPTVEATATTTITPEPTSTVTSEQGVNSETIGRQEIVQNINEFLAGSGKYSDEALKDNIFIYGPSSSLVASGLVENDLGLLSINPNFAVVQGINLGAVRGDNCVWLFWGTKMGDDKKREVIPVRIPLEDIEHRMPLVVLFYNQLDIYNDSVPPKYHEDKTVKMTSADDVLTTVNALINKPFIIDLYHNYPGDIKADVRSIIDQNGGNDTDFDIVYKLYNDMLKVYANSVCDFHPVAHEVIPDDQKCGTGYRGVEIVTGVDKFDESWLNNPNSISTTLLTTYVDNND